MRYLTAINLTQFQVRFNMKKLKVMTIVGTRPEIIRLSRVIHALDNYCDHILVHTGQNYDYELNEIFFNDLDMQILIVPFLCKFALSFLDLLILAVSLLMIILLLQLFSFLFLRHAHHQQRLLCLYKAPVV